MIKSVMISSLKNESSLNKCNVEKYRNKLYMTSYAQKFWAILSKKASPKTAERTLTVSILSSDSSTETIWSSFSFLCF